MKWWLFNNSGQNYLRKQASLSPKLFLQSPWINNNYFKEQEHVPNPHPPPPPPPRPIPKSILTVTSCQFAGERFRRCNSIEFRVGGRREAFKLSSLLFACTWVSKLNFLNNVVATLTFNFKSYLPRPRIHPRDIFYNTFLQGGSTTVCTNVECHLAVTNVSQFYTKMKSFAFYSKDKTASTGATYISRCWGLWNLIIHLAKATFLVILLLCSTENHLKCHFSEQD